jgi:hypothetical protein
MESCPSDPRLSPTEGLSATEIHEHDRQTDRVPAEADFRCRIVTELIPELCYTASVMPQFQASSSVFWAFTRKH